MLQKVDIESPEIAEFFIPTPHAPTKASRVRWPYQLATVTSRELLAAQP